MAGGLFVFLGIEARDRKAYKMFKYFWHVCVRNQPKGEDGTSKNFKWVSLRVFLKKREKKGNSVFLPSLFECKKIDFFKFYFFAWLSMGAWCLRATLHWLERERNKKYVPTPFIFCLAVSCTKSDNSPEMAFMGNFVFFDLEIKLKKNTIWLKYAKTQSIWAKEEKKNSFFQQRGKKKEEKLIFFMCPPSLSSAPFLLLAPP